MVVYKEVKRKVIKSVVIHTHMKDRTHPVRRARFFSFAPEGGSLFRVRFHAGETSDFIALVEMRNEGMTDIAAMITL